ncbi:glycosyltransferase family 4 protein [Flavobacteriaceae bacterium F08102]|nr:glycosyltransferase family 4 protein [Flavobacteriaceae bacterium F08102]
MIKVLFSTTSFETIDNGPALFANLLKQHLSDENGYILKMVTEDIENSTDEVYKIDLKKNRFNKFFYQFFRIYKYYKKAKEINKEFNYDLLVYNNAFTGVLSTIFDKKPVIVMVNDDNKLSFKRNKIKFTKAFFKFNMLYLLEKKAAQNADVVIVNSKYMNTLIQRVYHISSNKVQTLIKGINVGRYSFPKKGKFENEIQVLFVKADFKRGGLFDLITAISLLPEYSIKLNIIGPPVHTLNEIKEFLKKKNVLNYNLHGPLHPDEVLSYFKKCDIFSVPSYKEALGVANMEALASRLSVISTNVGGIPEVLDYGKCGWLIEPGNPQELSRAIKECIENEKMRLEKIENGFKHVQTLDSRYLIENFKNILLKAKGI